MAYINRNEVNDTIIVKNKSQLVVPYSYDSEQEKWIATDVSFEDIENAIGEKRPVIATIPGKGQTIYLTMQSSSTDEFIIFIGMLPDGSTVTVGHTSSDVITVNAKRLTDVYIVTFTQNQTDSYDADHILSTINEQLNVGNLVIGKLTINNNTTYFTYVSHGCFIACTDNTITKMIYNSSVSGVDKYDLETYPILHDVRTGNIVAGAVTLEKTDFFTPLDLSEYTSTSHFYDAKDLDNDVLYMVTASGRFGHAYVDPEDDTNIKNQSVILQSNTIINRHGNIVWVTGAQNFVFSTAWSARASSLAKKGPNSIWNALIETAREINEGGISTIEEFCQNLSERLGDPAYA